MDSEIGQNRNCKAGDDDLLNVYDNCERVGSADATTASNAIRQILIGRDQLAVGDTGLKLDSPVGKFMIRIINSPEAMTAAVSATQKGEPALVAVEPLLVRYLGLSYMKRYEATIQAGYVVAKMMRRCGYQQTRKKGQMPEGSTATSAEIYSPKK